MSLAVSPSLLCRPRSPSRISGFVLRSLAFILAVTPAAKAQGVDVSSITISGSVIGGSTQSATVTVTLTGPSTRLRTSQSPGLGPRATSWA
jgi:hypothetical protein